MVASLLFHFDELALRAGLFRAQEHDRLVRLGANDIAAAGGGRGRAVIERDRAA